MGKFTQEELDKVNKTLSTSEDCLKWAFDNLHPKLAKASSFGAEDAAIIDMMFKINSDSCIAIYMVCINLFSFLLY